MKKWIALLLLVLLCLPMLAVAEDVAHETYTDPAGRYAFSYPSAWTVVSKENFEAALDEAEKVDDADFVTLLQSMRGQLTETDMVILMSDNMISNINLLPQEIGMAATEELLNAIGGQIQTSLMQQMPGIVFQQEPYLIDLQAGESVLMMEYTYDVAGYEFYCVQSMHTKGTTLYTVTLTSDRANVEADAQVLGWVLGSLTVK